MLSYKKEAPGESVEKLSHITKHDLKTLLDAKLA